MTTLRYQIGDVAWYASFENERFRYECPDCGGTGRIRCIMHDETMVSVECRNCQSGFDPPCGHVVAYHWVPRASKVEITGFEISDSEERYQAANHYRMEPDRLFPTETAAMAKAMAMSAQHQEDERKRLLGKEKDTRSWAWNASYHRKQLKEAQRNLEYHSVKLAVASLKAKEKAE